MQYRRSRLPGATYFFTIVTFQRQSIFHDAIAVEVLRSAFRDVMVRMPFQIDAIVVLPEHIHCLWTLPEGDADFSTRWRLIKGNFTQNCPVEYQQVRSMARLRKGEKAVWQRRFWEHKIRDEIDFANHYDYIHFNPVRHGLVTRPQDWPYSSFHRAVKEGHYQQHGILIDVPSRRLGAATRNPTLPFTQ
jgi:putative transposase